MAQERKAGDVSQQTVLDAKAEEQRREEAVDQSSPYEYKNKIRESDRLINQNLDLMVKLQKQIDSLKELDDRYCNSIKESDDITINNINKIRDKIAIRRDNSEKKLEFVIDRLNRIRQYRDSLSIDSDINNNVDDLDLR